MAGLRLYKSERLCSKTEIERLYGQGRSLIAYPLRAVYLAVPATEPHRQPAKMLISIPKKRIRHAVDRVLLRRRTRESYRLNRHLLYPAARQAGVTVLIGFNWVAKSKHDYRTVEAKMQELLVKIAGSVCPTEQSPEP